RPGPAAPGPAAGPAAATPTTGDGGELAWEEDYYRQAWDAVTATVRRHGAAISHHHGIGLNRSRFLADALGTGFEVLASVKEALDPAGILNPGKLGLPSRFGPAPWP
ncbi:MAG TPA: FAD-linked oxidase C-terminal domain-containing protein, partial [Acidimicrobiales bacterium]|nr:FAD-linked oxidase C-terminal domain-containing protein [Acidimicrobiales bacterium]